MIIPALWSSSGTLGTPVGPGPPQGASLKNTPNLAGWRQRNNMNCDCDPAELESSFWLHPGTMSFWSHQEVRPGWAPMSSRWSCRTRWDSTVCGTRRPSCWTARWRWTAGSAQEVKWASCGISETGLGGLDRAQSSTSSKSKHSCNTSGCSREGTSVFSIAASIPMMKNGYPPAFDGLKGAIACVCFTLCRTGEFRVAVTVFNLVSSASLSSHVFVVTRPCQPPAVKNMGPSELQVKKNLSHGP